MPENTSNISYEFLDSSKNFIYDARETGITLHKYILCQKMEVSKKYFFSFFIMGSVHQIMDFISCEPVDHFLDPLPVFLFLRYHPVNCCLLIFFTCF